MRSEDYLNEIRTSPGLKRAVLKKLTVDGDEVTFHLATDLTYSKEDLAHAETVSQKYVPEGFRAKVDVVKAVPGEEGVRAAIAELLKTKFPAAAAFISPKDIEVMKDGGGGRFLISVGEEERAQFVCGDVLNVLSRELMRSFCGSWYGDFVAVERKQTEMEHDELPPAEAVVAPRTFEIANYVAIDGANPKIALYCADLNGEQLNVTLCGAITHIEERLTKNGKPYFRITVTDGSGQVSASYFTRKTTLEKIRSLKAGDLVCLSGNHELYNGSFTFTVKNIDYGTPPEGFKPQARASRPVPAKYIKVQSEPIEDLIQADLFGTTTLPADFCKMRFVVFDLETTGLNNNPVGGAMDRIIEIGAVKIENGRICERFSSFVACPVRLSGEIIKITGITDDMLTGAPEIGDVVADFFKFCDGSVLVGHNVQFDYKFVRHYGEQEGYLFDHRQYDTVTFAQEMLHLSNYKLNTVADHFGFSFHHHRAYDDAFVTAKIFLELVKLKGALPKY